MLALLLHILLKPISAIKTRFVSERKNLDNMHFVKINVSNHRSTVRLE